MSMVWDIRGETEQILVGESYSISKGLEWHYAPGQARDLVANTEEERVSFAKQLIDDGFTTIFIRKRVVGASLTDIRENGT